MIDPCGRWSRDELHESAWPAWGDVDDVLSPTSEAVQEAPEAQINQLADGWIESGRVAGPRLAALLRARDDADEAKKQAKRRKDERAQERQAEAEAEAERRRPIDAANALARIEEANRAREAGERALVPVDESQGAPFMRLPGCNIYMVDGSPRMVGPESEHYIKQFSAMKIWGL